MVLYHKQYTKEGENHQMAISQAASSEIANAIMEHFALETQEKFEDWANTTELFCRGEEVSLESVLAQFIQK